MREFSDICVRMGTTNSLVFFENALHLVSVLAAQGIKGGERGRER